METPSVLQNGYEAAIEQIILLAPKLLSAAFIIIVGIIIAYTVSKLSGTLLSLVTQLVRKWITPLSIHPIDGISDASFPGRDHCQIVF